jgi:flavin-dependent dehydrogenase
MVRSTDVFVIGGGPAGLAAAIAARNKGFSVTVADGAQPPIDKACGEGLMPDSVRVLKHLGVELAAPEVFPFRGVRFIDGNLTVEADFGIANGMGVRRMALHQKMIEHAQGLGITLLWKAPVAGISFTGVTVAGKRTSARWIIGADGIRSRVRRWSGCETCTLDHPRFAFRRHYRIEPWSDYAEVHWGQRGQAYVTPVGDQDVCVVLISRDPQLRFNSLDTEFPKLTERLSLGSPSDTERGAIPVSRSPERVYGNNVALIGDASGSVDAITGEGLALSFHQALALADALEAGDLRRYQVAHQRLVRRARITERLLLLLDRQPSLRKRVFRTFSKHPKLFSRFLAAHIGATSSGELAAAGVLLGWRLVTA